MGEENKNRNENSEGQLNNYFQYVVQTLRKPDHLLSDRVQGKSQFGLITIIAFLVLGLISSFISLLDYSDALRSFGFNDYFGYTTRALAYTASLALVIFAYKSVAEKNGKKYDFNFFYEKLGSLLVIPCILLIVSIILELVNIRIYGWFASLAYTFFYLAIFLISYLYIAKSNLKTAMIFVGGFYLVYRLILFIL